MAAKNKVLAARSEIVAAQPSANSIPVPASEGSWSREEIDRQWEQIRIRGEQISADIKALHTRISSN